MNAEYVPQGVRFNLDGNPDILIYGIELPNGTILELDAAHVLWGHSGNGVGTIHERPQEMEPITLKSYMLKRLEAWEVSP